MYHQPGYPVPATHGYQYPAPAMHGYPYSQPLPPPPPMHVYHLDPSAFRRDYAARLTELTVNSRPIIQNLSMIAQEYSRWAEIVAQCLEAHIRRVPAWMKLPAFYLLDAISKNVFEPYARQFATLVIPLFLETYEAVDQNTRGKMEEMLLTWRTGAPAGKELFGVVPQVAIERGVWGGDLTGGADPQSRNGFYSGSGQINKSMVISELEFTLGQKERALQANPYDSVSQNHINVLQQLRKLVEAGVSQEELRQILNQLRALVQAVPPPPQLLTQVTTTYPPLAPQVHTTATSYATYATPPVIPVSHPSSLAPTTYIDAPLEQPNIDISVHAPPLDNAGLSNSAPAGSITDLFNTLLKAGLVSASVTPTGAGATSQEDGEKASTIDLERESSRTYRKLILAQKIKLTSADITKTRPQIVDLLYDQLPAQCKQCGVRFSDSPLGKKKMDAHLDMHFRQNRKANQNIGRGHSRSWFVGLEDWINDMSNQDTKGKGRADGSGRFMNAKAAAVAEVAKRDAELRAQYVVVPPGDEAKLVSCPICKETLKSEFLEDDEEWVWRNAIMKDDKVYHATCHAEAAASAKSLIARLRSEVANQSRSSTPEGSKSSTPPPSSGTKRKAEDGDPAVKVEGSPPLKKISVTLKA